MDHRSRQEFLRLVNFEKKFKNFNLKSLITDHRIKCHATMSNIYLFTCYEIFSLMLRSYEILFFLPWIFHSNLVFSCYIEYKDLLVICSKRAAICFVGTMYLAIHNWPKNARYINNQIHRSRSRFCSFLFQIWSLRLFWPLRLIT